MQCPNVEMSADGTRARPRENPTHWPQYYLDNPKLHVANQPWQPSSQMQTPTHTFNPDAPAFVPRVAAGKQTHSSGYVTLILIYGLIYGNTILTLFFLDF